MYEGRLEFKFSYCIPVILGKSHYLLYVLATAMQPRWLVTLDENLQPLNVSVRVGQVMYLNIIFNSSVLCL